MNDLNILRVAPEIEQNQVNVLSKLEKLMREIEEDDDEDFEKHVIKYSQHLIGGLQETNKTFIKLVENNFDSKFLKSFAFEYFGILQNSINDVNNTFCSLISKVLQKTKEEQEKQ